MNDFDYDLISTDKAKYDEWIKRSLNGRPFTLQKIVLDLTTARDLNNAYKISVPFNSVFVREATDSNTTVSIFLHDNDLSQSQNAIAIKNNDSFGFDNPIGRAFLTWSAQSGKSITIYFILRALFQSGSQLSVSSGGVSVTDGDSVTQTNNTTLTTTAASLIASNSSRKLCFIQNQGSVDIYIGSTSSVTSSGSTRGILVPAGGSFAWRSTAAVYGITASGTASIQISEFS